MTGQHHHVGRPRWCHHHRSSDCPACCGLRHTGRAACLVWTRPQRAELCDVRPDLPGLCRPHRGTPAGERGNRITSPGGSGVRILAVADLHYRLKHWDWLVQAAEGVDVVAIAGDLADVASPVPVEVQSVVLGEYLDRARRARRRPRRVRQPRPGRAGRARRAGRRLAAAAPRGLGRHRRRQRRRGGTRFTVCPWWDGPRQPGRRRGPARRRRGRPAGALGLGLPLAAGRHGAVPRRPA